MIFLQNHWDHLVPTPLSNEVEMLTKYAPHGKGQTISSKISKYVNIVCCWAPQLKVVFQIPNCSTATALTKVWLHFFVCVCKYWTPTLRLIMTAKDTAFCWCRLLVLVLWFSPRKFGVAKWADSNFFQTWNLSQTLHGHMFLEKVLHQNIAWIATFLAMKKT